MTDIVTQLREGLPHRLIENHWMIDHEAVDIMLEQAALEIEKLRSLVRAWHYQAVGPDEMGDYHTHKQLIAASEPYASEALVALYKRHQGGKGKLA